MSGRKDVQTSSKQAASKQQASERFVKMQKCQEQARSKDSSSMRQRCREFRNIKDKDFQEITQSTAVPARQSGAVPIGAPLSL